MIVLKYHDSQNWGLAKKTSGFCRASIIHNETTELFLFMNRAVNARSQCQFRDYVLSSCAKLHSVLLRRQRPGAQERSGKHVPHAANANKPCAHDPNHERHFYSFRPLFRSILFVRVTWSRRRACNWLYG